jgi:hypothetical protein
MKANIVVANMAALLVVAGCGGGGANQGGNTAPAQSAPAQNPPPAQASVVGKWGTGPGGCGPTKIVEFVADGHLTEGGRPGGTWTAAGNQVTVTSALGQTMSGALSGSTLTLAGATFTRCP